MCATSERLEPVTTLPIAEAERYCAETARREAKNFYWGFIALPRPKRTAIYALYAFAREVDDEADQPRAARNPAHLAQHRNRLQRCLDGDYDDPVMQVLGQTIAQYQIPGDELTQIIDGVEMDLHRNRYESWEELSQYCNLVASSVGRMCVRIFGFRDPSALDYADQLGQAMQLTNILRDMREDYRDFGRIYLPADDLARFGIGESAIAAALAPNANGAVSALGPGWAEFIHFQTTRAWNLFDDGLRVADQIPTSSAACVLTMAGIYRDILRQVERDPWLPLRQRISLSNRAKLGVMAKSWLRAV